MNDLLLLILLTPVIVLLILALFRFTACVPTEFEFKAADPANPPPGQNTNPPPDQGTNPPPDQGTIPPPPPTYAEQLASTQGFAAYWPLDETGGNQVNMIGPLSPPTNPIFGQYEPTGAAGLNLGKPGALKSGVSLAPEFLGTDAYVEVPFIGALNPQTTVAFSVELWVKPDPDLGKGTQALISSHDVAGGRGYEILLIKVKKEPHQLLQGHVFSGGASSEVKVQVPEAVGNPKEWRYVVMTYEAGSNAGAGTLTLRVRLASSPDPYFDSNPAAAYANVDPASPVTLRFGSSHNAGKAAGDFFAGQIDEVAFYNVALLDGVQLDHFTKALA